MVISVCIGSSCHLKGAYRIIEQLKDLISENGLDGQVELKAHFCSGMCTRPVSVQIDHDPCIQLDAEDISRFFQHQVWERTEHEHH